jgi:hypothetical protein
MSFFEFFPSTSYEKKTVTNILTAFLLKRDQINNLLFFQRYVINDGETPMSIAKKLYKDERLHWVILLVNEIVDPYYDFILPSNFFEKFVNAKYEDGIEGIHHFWDTNIDRECDEVDSAKYRDNLSLVPAGVRVVTNYEYEVEQNGDKREILVVNPVYIVEFVEMIRKTLKNAK